MTGTPRPAARVLTLTLNPALDLTVRADHLTLDTVNAGQGLRTDAGGKGVNVARVLADHGVNVTATGLLGQDNAEPFEALFEQRGIEDAFLWVPGSTRVGVKLVDHAAQQTTDINLPGLQATPDTLGELHARLRDLQATHDVLVLSGSVPPGVPTTVYADLIREWRAAGKTVVLDTSGEPLRHALHAGASIVKPNIHELEGALGHPLGSETDVLHAAHVLLASGTDLVVVSQGERGALFVTRDAALLATPSRVSVQSTVGAGDAMVAGLVTAHVRGLNLPDTARLATASSLGAITSASRTLPDHATLTALAERVTVTQVETPAPTPAAPAPSAPL